LCYGGVEEIGDERSRGGGALTIKPCDIIVEYSDGIDGWFYAYPRG
jgi:hypothetical protein